MEEKLGPFILKEIIGQGGMGTVWKAYDPINHRTIALKVIKASLLKNPKSKKRFLKEAYIHAKLSHPSIIPIHGIQIHPDGVGYAMPFIEGSTLKTHLIKLSSQPSLIPLKERLRHIIKVLEALDYTHEKGYVHRDIKADNIFIGLHGETYLFDWGLASKIDAIEKDFEEEQNLDHHLTKPGKIPGTLSHLAPERAEGIKGSIQSDIFSLGVVLYQLLTYKMPFYRKDLEHFKQLAGKETFILPSKLNLKEDIDESLDVICKRALANDLKERYSQTKQFREDLQKVLDGLPIWKDPLLLDINRASDWLYQDTLPLGSYLALTQKSLSWGLLSIPNLLLVDNYKLLVATNPEAKGFKIYLNLAHDVKGFDFEHCYILTIEPNKSISLHRVFALIDEKPLMGDAPLELSIEKIENRFIIRLNALVMFDIWTRLPSLCPYLGLVIEDEKVPFSSLALYSASSSKQISCLKLGDNLILHRSYDKARLEYEKIITSFQDHQEAQEALFRLSYSYILEAKEKKTKRIKLLNLGITNFERFKAHKASPWEYWGKALCYKALGQKLEMIKCFELGFRKYPRHVFTEELKEELVVLFSQKSVQAKKEALRLTFIALCYLDEAAFFYKYPHLIESLEEELGSCFALLETSRLSAKQKLIFALAFALNQKTFLKELLTKSEQAAEKTNALLILLHLKAPLPAKLKIPFENSSAGKLSLLASCLYGKAKTLPEGLDTPEQAFLQGLISLVQHKRFNPPAALTEYDQKIIKTLHAGLKLPVAELITLFKAPFFQEAERFIRSNFIISLLEKKPLDYFGYDKAWLEFAIKALF